MSDDTKKILQKFHVLLRENVNVLEVYRSMTGLSEFDMEQIHCERTNHGNTLAMDTLINTVGRKSTLAFVSFVHSLQKYGQEDIANKIINETQENFPNIYRLLMKPTAAILPSMKNSNSEVEKNDPTGLSENTMNDLTSVDTNPLGKQGTFNGALNIEQSFNSLETNNTILETHLDSLENADFLYLVEQLGPAGQWEKLATKLKLKRKDIKDLGREENSAEKLLDDFCCHLTVQKFLDYLQMADLGNIAESVKDHLCITEDTQSGVENWSDKTEEQAPNAIPDHINEPAEQLNVPLHSDESLTDNTKIQNDDEQLHIPVSNKTTNIGSINTNPLNVENVVTLNVIYQFTKNNSDESVESDRHKPVTDNMDDVTSIEYSDLSKHEKTERLVVTSEEEPKNADTCIAITSEERKSSIISVHKNPQTEVTSHENTVLEELNGSEQDCTAVKTFEEDEQEFRDIQNSVPDTISSISENDN